MKQIGLIIFQLLLFGNIYSQQLRTINIDVDNVRGRHSKVFKNCVGAGRANEGLRVDWQQQLQMAHEEIGFKYIRFHGLLHDDMGVYHVDKDGNSRYSWDYIDKLYDFILEIGMKPLVELSFTPEKLKSGDETVFWWKGNITPPKSYEKYEEFIRALIKHFEDRYGHDEVKTWYFEVWNEPNHHAFFTGKREDYFKIYETAARAIKSVSTNYRVGGPATAGGQWVKEIMEFCDTNNVPLDFIATHVYGVEGFLDEFGTKQLKMISDPDNMAKQVWGLRNNTIAKSKYKGMEMHITEWNSSYSPRDPVHDTYQNASYVLNTLKQTEETATSMSYWTFTDIFEESGVPLGPFHGGFGLLNLQDIKKPTYFAYKYMNQLGSMELVNADSNSWVCKEGDDIQVLLWDFTFTGQDSISNQVYYKRELPSAKKGTTKLNFSNLSDGKYKLLVYKTGYKHNDAYTAYFNMGSPDNLSKTQVAELKDRTKDAPVLEKQLKVKNGKYNMELILDENDIYLVKLIKEQ
ncbi:MAG: glycoside hydrolase [Bacteroidota bacterium]